MVKALPISAVSKRLSPDNRSLGRSHLDPGSILYFIVGQVLLLGLGLRIVDAGLLWLGGRIFRRSELIANL